MRGVTELAIMRPDLAAEWHPRKNDVLTPSTVSAGSNKKAWWLCVEGHEWEAMVNSRNRGSGCPYCSGHFVIVGETDLATVNPSLALEWNPTKNGDITPRDVASGSNRKAWWLCAQGHEWEAVIGSRHGGRGCPYCSGNFVVVGETDLATVNPSLALEWNPTKNGDITPRDVRSGSGKKVWWLCTQGHEWEASIAGRNSGSGCPVCAGQKVLAGFNDLATLNPGLAAEWNPTKNGDITPRDVTSGSKKKTWWLCAQGHEWEALVGDRNSGNGCPYCSGRLVIRGETDLVTVNPSLALEWNPTKNGDITPRDVISGSNKKAWWVCAQGHEWNSSIADRNRGSGCPVCAGQKVLAGFNDLATTNPDLAAEWNPTKNDDITPRDVTSSSGKKAWWVCAEGHEWEATIANRQTGSGCPVCAGQKVLAGFNDLATLNPALAAEWNPAKNGHITPRDVISGSNKKAWWVCAQGHEWNSSIADRNRGSGCPVCAGKQVLVGFNDLATTNPDLAAEWNPTKNDDITPRDVTSGSNNKTWWLCPEGHEWQAHVTDRNTGYGCPICSGYQVLVGFNDLATTNPDLAAEWHPTKNSDLTSRDVIAGTEKKAWWLCAQGHEWAASIKNRHGGSGCPGCATHGYDATSDGYLYLLRKERLGLHQFGITNTPKVRIAKHRSNGWEALDIVGPADGHWIREIETALKLFFSAKGLLLTRDHPDKFDGYSESWHSDELSFSACAEMLEALRAWES